MMHETGWHEQLPKVELHVHLEGAIPHTALWDLIQKYGGDNSVPTVQALQKRFEYTSFPEFIEAWSWKNGFLREYEDFTHIAELTARDLASQNVRYAEVFFSPSLFVKHGLDVQELTWAVRRGLAKVPEIDISLIADLVRDYGPESETLVLRKLREVKDKGVLGIGIGGSEHEFPPEPFEALYDEARRMGFRTTAHAGEAAGPESVWGAVNRLKVDRIGHGTRACEDQGLVKLLTERRIPVEMCPVSNLRTGVVSELRDHPIRSFYEQGMVVSVNTDDPKMFGTSLAHEYRLLEQHCGFSKHDICRLVLLAIESSWLSAERKASLAARLANEDAWQAVQG